MHPTRREIIRVGLGSSTLLALGSSVPTFLATSAGASTGSKKGHILVVVQLDGGNDGLNTVVPYLDDAYLRLRPRLAIPSREVKKIDDRVGFHPELTAFSKLLEDGRLAVIQGVGYPNPNRSHFESMGIWQTAELDPDVAAPGWLARALDRRANPGGDAPALHVQEQSALPRALCGGQQLIPSVDRLEQLRRVIGLPEGSQAEAQREALDLLGGLGHGQPGSLLQFVERTHLVGHGSSKRLESIGANTREAGGYPEYHELARRLCLIAQLIKAGLTTSIYYTQLDGFDTHSDQLRTHSGLLSQLGASLRAFLDDLTRCGESERVIVLVFSEFGRRVAENASGGTDHGTAAPVFLLGANVRGGLYGRHPELGSLLDGDPVHFVDFRRVYAALLDGWLGISSRDVLGGDFEPLAVFRA